MLTKQTGILTLKSCLSSIKLLIFCVILSSYHSIYTNILCTQIADSSFQGRLLCETGLTPAGVRSRNRLEVLSDIS